MLSEFLNNYLFTTEFLSVLCSLLYLFFIIREIKWAWPLAFMSSTAMIFTAFHAKLYMEIVLQFYYVIMAVIGWFSWSRKSKLNIKTPICRWPLRYHLINISISLLLSFVLGYIMDKYTDQALPYLDTLTTVFALTTTWMVTQKVLENWIYWIIVNGVSIFMMYNRGLYWACLLMVLFTFMAIQGYFQWKKSYQLQNETN